MQTAIRCSLNEEVIFVQTHNRSRILLKPQGQVMQAHGHMQIQTQVLAVVWRNLILTTRH